MVHLQPFALFPQLKRNDADGVDRATFLRDLALSRRPDEDEDARKKKLAKVRDEWEKDGLRLNFSGKLGNSFDAQRLIWWAKLTDREDQMVEALLKAAHTDGKCLSDRRVLLDCATAVGFHTKEITTFLDNERGMSDVAARITSYFDQGINSVPVVVFDDKFPFVGASDWRTLRDGVEQLLDTGEIDAVMPSANNSQNCP